MRPGVLRAWGKARLPFRVSRYGVKPLRADFPRDYPTPLWGQEGFPDMSRVFTAPRGAAGQVRDLPDKELRYLRTVIVTAGLHRGFGSELAPLPLTYRQWPGFSPYTSPFGLAGTCVFGKQSPGPILCGLPDHWVPPAAQEAPLLPRLRGHFAEFLDRSWLVHLWILTSPTCVGLRYGLRTYWLEAFLGRSSRPPSPLTGLAITPRLAVPPPPRRARTGRLRGGGFAYPL